MIVDKFLLEAVGIVRTSDTLADNIKFFEAMKDPANVDRILSAQKQNSYPFYRFFSNYGTGIGETIEEAIGVKFKEMVPKQLPKVSAKTGMPLKGFIKNPVYTDYNKLHNKKASNYDWLANLNTELVCIEVKVIRAAESKPGQTDKLNELPSLLEERALAFVESAKSGNGSFQQTKAELFDYLLGVVMYADQVDFYLVPSADIKSGKLKITNQHAGAILEDGSTNEGHLAYRDLEEYKFLSVYSEEELLAADSLAKYIK